MPKSSASPSTGVKPALCTSQRRGKNEISTLRALCLRVQSELGIYLLTPSRGSGKSTVRR
ncbi:hypothetical protein FOVG_05667 [Fusarium oxysporum f. sp. pisi HDV247]|uniref:Uncharacterized protein n=1 Tax=Fusarium oxysporum f. sp. pisi HDV247 TaxID=1080344 RepID=W9PWW9_FUSOX|nr:hypothetical protein FOVG_05667 [Fusarium oxysporum f. sp. pisi HDV247]